MYTITQRLLAGILALVAFFVNRFAAPSAEKTPDDAESIVYADTAFGDVKLFLPDDVLDGTDIIFMIHGGAWMFGDAGMFYDNCRDAVQAGYIAASMNYDKIQNGASALDMASAVEQALIALRKTLTQKGITPGKLIMAGHSAGAHIMLLYAYTRYAECPFDLAFLVSNCAAAEFLSDAKTKSTTLGRYAYLLLTGLTKEVILPWTLSRNADAIDAISPLAHVSPDVPPTIVVQGTADELIPYQNSLALYNALQQNGVDCVHISYEGAGHFLGKQFTEENAARAAAFEAFAQKYCR